MGLAADTDLLTFGNATLAITGAVTGVTSLQVDNLNINGNTISSTAGTDLLITPLGGQQIVLDGTIIIDAGVVTGATSITSTEFHGGGGNLTGIAAGPSQANQAAIEAETNQDTYVPPDLMKYHPGVAKAWCRVSVSQALESPNYNIDSVTDNGTGDYTPVFGTDFSSAVYVPTSFYEVNAKLHIRTISFATGSIRIITLSDSAQVDTISGVSVHGDQ